MPRIRKEGREKLNYGTDPTQSWLLQELFLEWAFSFLLSWVTITTALGYSGRHVALKFLRLRQPLGRPTDKGCLVAAAGAQVPH